MIENLVVLLIVAGAMAALGRAWVRRRAARAEGPLCCEACGGSPAGGRRPCDLPPPDTSAPERDLQMRLSDGH